MQQRAQFHLTLQPLKRFVDQIATLTILVFSQLDLSLAQTQVALEVGRIDLNGFLGIFKHQLKLLVPLECSRSVRVDDVIVRVKRLNSVSHFIVDK